jgi:hypothetical protein
VTSTSSLSPSGELRFASIKPSISLRRARKRVWF